MFRIGSPHSDFILAAQIAGCVCSWENRPGYPLAISTYMVQSDNYVVFTKGMRRMWGKE
jgi:hypothetical protein